MSEAAFRSEHGPHPDRAVLTPFASLIPRDAAQHAERVIDGRDAHLLSDCPTTTARNALELYGLRLGNTEITGATHPGLKELVTALSTLDPAAPIVITHISSDAGVVSLVNEASGEPIGLVVPSGRTGNRTTVP